MNWKTSVYSSQAVATFVGLLGGYSLLKLALSIVTSQKIKKRVKQKDVKVCIIGAGVSGICTAAKLKQAGIPFKIFEKNEEAGGTWLENDYPAAACDVPAYAYSFSFARNPSWSVSYAARDELLPYFVAVAKRFGVYENISFKSKILSCTFHEKQKQWTVIYEDLTSGKRSEEKFMFVVTATGQLNQAKIPNVQGKDTFTGTQFHTTHWNYSIDLKGKHVLGVGTGPSAIQAFPETAKQCGKMTILQRSPTYFYKRGDINYGSLTKFLYRWIPFATFFRYYYGLFAQEELFYFFYNRREVDENGNDKPTFLQKVFKKVLRQYLNQEMDVDFNKFKVINEGLFSSDSEAKQIFEDYNKKKTEIKKKLTPDILPGCKRIALSNQWYKSMARSNVDLVESKGIKEIKRDLVIIETNDGKEMTLKPDIIVWATGFHTSSFATHIDIKVVKGNGETVSLREQWKNEPMAYKGVIAENFPNLFVLYGPNTNLGHNSIIYMIECQVQYAVRLMKETLLKSNDYFLVKKQAFNDYNEKMQKDLKGLVFSGQCGSWYRTESGHQSTNWSSGIFAFQYMMSKTDFRNFVFF